MVSVFLSFTEVGAGLSINLLPHLQKVHHNNLQYLQNILGLPTI